MSVTASLSVLPIVVGFSTVTIDDTARCSCTSQSLSSEMLVHICIVVMSRPL